MWGQALAGMSNNGGKLVRAEREGAPNRRVEEIGQGEGIRLLSIRRAALHIMQLLPQNNYGESVGGVSGVGARVLGGGGGVTRYGE